MIKTYSVDWLAEDKSSSEITTTDNLFSVEYSQKSQIQQKLRISITDGCNFNCFFCHNEGQGHVTKNTGEMSVVEITKLIEIAVKSGVRSVKLTGGEPLIYRHNHQGIVDLVASINNIRQRLPEFSLSLITNGYLLKQYAAELKSAGLDRINVSLPTLRDDVFHKYIRQSESGSITRVVEGVSEAIAVGLQPLKVNTVIFESSISNQGNINEIVDIVTLCKKLGVSELRLYTLLWHPRFKNFDEYYKYWDSDVFSTINALNCDLSDEIKNSFLASLRDFANKWSKILYPKARMVIDFNGLPVAFETMMAGRFGQEAPCDDCEHPHLCQEGPYALRASAIGDVRGCLLSSKSINMLKAIRSKTNDNELLSMFKSSFSLLPKG